MHLDGELGGARSGVRPNPGHEAIRRLGDAGPAAPPGAARVRRRAPTAVARRASRDRRAEATGAACHERPSSLEPHRAAAYGRTVAGARPV